MGGPADIDFFRDFATELADAARRETLPRFRARAAVLSKAGAAFDPVTDADREAERALRGLIAARYPDHGIIGEEFGAEREDAARRWVLDPVDGTRAFVCGVPSWTTLIALEEGARPVLGLIDQPFTDERWIGVGGETVYRRAGAPLGACRTSGLRDLGAARLSTTDPSRAGYFTAPEAAAFAKVMDAARLARFSLDAYAYGLLALGELDLVIEASLKRHDFAALQPVVEGAGGVITGWRGEPLGADPRGRVIAAASPALHEAALEFLREV
ncbi:MAG: histidinol-phosphatase [Amphiplicatus sp.]